MADLTSVADELYALLPGRFTAERNAAAKRAKADGDKSLAQQIGALSKPSVAAWAVNSLVRHRRKLMDGFLSLGEALRAAQDDLDGTALRQLSTQRRAVVEQLATEAERLGDELGQAVSTAAREDVEGTLQAALADGDAAEAIMSGRLVRALAVSGFDPVDVGDAVAGGPGRAPARSSARGQGEATTKRDDRDRNDIEQARRKREQELEQRRAEQESAAAALDAATKRRDEVRERRAEAQRDRDRLRERLDELQEQMERLGEELAGQSSVLRRASADEEDAEDALSRAQREADRADERLTSLEDRLSGRRGGRTR